MQSPAERMATLFAGFQGSHGTHGDPEQDPDSQKWKISSTARTLPGPATIDLWNDHLDGRRPLGLAPIREDNTCMWGSGDIDDYDINILDVIVKVKRMKLPLVPCRSKSGGLHLFIFLLEPAPAIEVQRYLADALARLGYANSEVFPKQVELKIDRGDQPNWIVLPYFGGTYGNKLKMQVGIKPGGTEQLIGEFLDYAESMRQPRDTLAKRARSRANGADTENMSSDFADGPPCLQHLVSGGGIKPGHQNNTLLMMGIYYKKAHPENWKQMLEQANQVYLDPPGSAPGLASAINSLDRKEYNYTCKKEPMHSHCNAAICRMRKHGIGDQGAYPRISGLAKLDTDPPIWFVSVDDSRIEIDTDTLQIYSKFTNACMRYLNIGFVSMSQSDWALVIHHAMKDVHLIPTTPDVGRPGIFHEQLEEFLTNRQRGTQKEDLLRGRPWEDEDEGRHYFRLGYLQKYLVKEGNKDMTRGQITQYIKKMGGGPHEFFIKGKYVRTYWIPSGVVQNTPRSDPPPIKGAPI